MFKILLTQELNDVNKNCMNEKVMVINQFN